MRNPFAPPTAEVTDVTIKIRYGLRASVSALIAAGVTAAILWVGSKAWGIHPILNYILGLPAIGMAGAILISVLSAPFLWLLTGIVLENDVIEIRFPFQPKQRVLYSSIQSADVADGKVILKLKHPVAVLRYSPAERKEVADMTSEVSISTDVCYAISAHRLAEAIRKRVSS
jgi:hypothetical protein